MYTSSKFRFLVIESREGRDEHAKHMVWMPNGSLLGYYGCHVVLQTLEVLSGDAFQVPRWVDIPFVHERTAMELLS